MSMCQQLFVVIVERNISLFAFLKVMVSYKKFSHSMVAFARSEPLTLENNHNNRSLAEDGGSKFHLVDDLEIAL